MAGLTRCSTSTRCRSRCRREQMPSPDSLLVRHDRPRNSHRLDFRQPSPPLAAVPLSPDRENGTARTVEQRQPFRRQRFPPLLRPVRRDGGDPFDHLRDAGAKIGGNHLRPCPALFSSTALAAGTMTPGSPRLSGAGPVHRKRATGTSRPPQRRHRIDPIPAPRPRASGRAPGAALPRQVEVLNSVLMTA